MSARRADVPGIPLSPWPSPLPSPASEPLTSYLVSCEHGGNRVPSCYQSWFQGHEALLRTHRGYDPGALSLARDLAKALGAQLITSTVSRLVIDLNRSLGHPRLYSEALRSAPRPIRDEVLARYYLPYRTKAEHLVATATTQGRKVIHISSHSFTPVLNGIERNNDIGLLYDPHRPGELALSLHWFAVLTRLAPHLKVRRNYPYTGSSDGFCTYLRRHFPPDAYVGIELEINQRHVLAGGPAWKALRRTVVESLEQALREADGTG